MLRLVLPLPPHQKKDDSRCMSKSNTAVSETMNRAPVRRRTSSARSDQMRR